MNGKITMGGHQCIFCDGEAKAYYTNDLYEKRYLCWVCADAMEQGHWYGEHGIALDFVDLDAIEDEVVDEETSD